MEGILGIVSEYNPFHNGHLYQINKIKEMFEDSTIILIMSSNFTQRGDASLINKWDKTTIALNNKIDLVVELPFEFATNGADDFAHASIKLLKELNVDYLIFGSESDDLEYLKECAKKQLSTDYKETFLKELKKGVNYPTALNKAYNININTPNDILALSYIREIYKQKAKITPISIKRTNNYHDKKLNNHITSATSIRENINSKDIKNYVPEITYKYLKKDIALTENYFPLLKYKIISENDLEIYEDVIEGMHNKLKKEINNAKSIDDLIKRIKSKRYTYSRLKRMVLHILIGYTKKENKKKKVKYIRVLGFNKNGQKYLNKVKKDLKLPLYTNFNKEMNLELKVTNIYSLIFDTEKRDELNKKEIKNLIKF